MAPRKPTSRSTLLSSYRIGDSDAKISKTNNKTRRTSKSGLKRQNGLLNASVPARSELINVAKRSSNASPLLRLPGEVRNIIWKYAVGYHRIDIGNRSCKRSWPIAPSLDVRPLHPARHFPRTFVRPTFAWARVCRQVYVESSAFIYTLNTFRFDSSATFDWWLKNRPIGQKRLVSSVDAPYDYMHLYRHGFRKSFHRKFPNIARIGIDENVPRFSRQCREDTVDMAKARIVEFIRAKEGRCVKIEWHYGVSGGVIYC